MSLSLSNVISALRRPAGAGLPDEFDFEGAEAEAKKWVREHKDANMFKKTSIGTYALGTLSLSGFLAAIFGKKNGNNTVTVLGVITGILGLIGATVSKIMGFEYNAVKAIQDRVLRGNPNSGNYDFYTRGNSHVKNVELNSGVEKLQGKYFEAEAQTGKLIIYFHGLGSSVDRCAGEILNLQKKVHANVLAVSPRSMGNSTSKTDETLGKDHFVADGEAIYKYATETLGFKREDIMVFGHSFGTFVGGELAKKNNLNMIAQCPFADPLKVANTTLGRYVPRALTDAVLNGCDPKKTFTDFPGKLVLIGCGQDEVMSPEELKALQKVCPKATVMTLPKAKHQEYFEQYGDAVFSRFNELLGIQIVSQPENPEIKNEIAVQLV